MYFHHQNPQSIELCNWPIVQKLKVLGVSMVSYGVYVQIVAGLEQL